MGTDPSFESSAAPDAEYARRLSDRRARAAALAAAERRIANGRLIVFVAGLAVAWLAFGIGLVRPALLFVPLLVFFGLVLRHGRVIERRVRADRAVAFYERGTARLEDRWAGTGNDGARFADPDHPYAQDLDLFGRGSLFELLCTARTRAGEETLARWLLAPAEPDEILARQQAADELRGKLDLWEDLALIGDDIAPRLHPEALAAWASSPPILTGTWMRAALPAAVVFFLIALVGSQMGLIGAVPLLAAIALEAAVTLPLRGVVLRVVRATELPVHDLGLLASLLKRLEAESFRAPRLAALRAAVETDGVPASRRIAQLERLITLLDARRNQLFAPIAPFLLWTTQLAYAVEAWRARWGADVGHWMAAVGELEAFVSLASYAYEHPADVWPELRAEGPLFDAAALGHPLLPRDRCVPNHLRLASDRAAIVISGSNMSGKSTLLRAVGVNAVLAQAGAPVRAGGLRLSPLAVGTSMRAQDSLQEGTSRFYAEIKRIRSLVDLAAGPRPLLFLLDEILHGTNSHDRRIGAEAIVRGLVEKGAIGLVTTHDLTLAHIAETLAPRSDNMHFEDHVENGVMTFDYRIRPGVVQKSNALALMRAIGLEV
jgi:hypothetical protein